MTSVGTRLSSLAVVVIGRNEGDRLRRCFDSQLNHAALVVYVDSGSTDDSLTMARSRGVEIVELNRSLPFSAARARNEGFDRVRAIMPDVEFVQFVDGDCEVVAGWLDIAVEALARELRLGVVCGRLRERWPDASIYNELCQLEWDTPVGEVASCGGIFMVRARAFEAVGRFNPTVTAGEEPELCQRLRDTGWVIRRLADEMALHDSAMLRFRQWWRRQVRTGYNGLDVATRFGQGSERLFVASVRSARIWGLGLPVLTIIASAAGAMIDGTHGVAIGLVAVVLLCTFQIARIALRIRRSGVSRRVAVQYGVLTLVSKLAHLEGQCRYIRDRAAGRAPALIEHKSTATT